MVGPDWLRKRMESASPDLLREMVATFIATLMGAEADAVCGAGYGEVSPERVNSRNGYRHRDFDTRVGTLDIGIPKLRAGSYFPDWLVTPRRRAEQALTSVVATCYLLGVSTRRVEKLVATLGIDKCVQVPGLGAGQEPGHSGGGVSQPTAGRRALHLLLDRRAGDAGP
jgi:putative transposase